MSVKLLTEYHLEFLRLKGDCTASSESTLVKIPHCWKSMSRLIYNAPMFAFLSQYFRFLIKFKWTCSSFGNDTVFRTNTYRVMCSMLQLSERWPCHIWLVGRMKFASLVVNLGGVWTFSLSHIFLSPSLWEESQHYNIVDWDSLTSVACW